MLDKPINTPRLTVRRFWLEDWPAVYEYTSDPAVMAYIPEGEFTKKEAQEFVTRNRAEPIKAYPVIQNKDGRLIGHMIFHFWFETGTYEIGWVFNNKVHGQGYATEAALALLKHGFETLKLHRIVATCQPKNVPSYRVMEKIGMRREGHFKECVYRGDSRWWDEYSYAILEEEFTA